MPMHIRLSTLIVDDERLSRIELSRMLALEGLSGLIFEADCADAAEKILGDHPIDILFLDIRMPRRDGFELLRGLEGPRPALIMTTAHEEFALEAFDHNAVDYLIKPFSQERLSAALTRLPERNRLKELRYLPPDHTVLLKHNGAIQLVPLSEIEFFETRANTTLAKASGKEGLLHKSMRRLMRQLDPSLYFRSSRNHLLNLSKVARFTTNGSNLILAELHSGQSLVFSRRQSQEFRKLRKL
jgi:two-component system LytT family response regulator